MGNRTPSLSESSSAGKWSSKLPTPRSDFTFTIGLAGVAQSGKTTLRKQLVLNQFLRMSTLALDSKLKDEYAILIRKNIWESFSQMAQLDRSKLGREFVDADKEATEELEKFFNEYAKKTPENYEIDVTLGKMMHKYWKASVIQRVWAEHRDKVPDIACNLDYFVSRLTEICKPTWTPSEEDILRVSSKTFGTIQEERLSMDGIKFKMLDFGGADYLRSQFKSQVIPKVDSIFYVVNLADYDRMSPDDDSVNLMKDSLSYWQELLDIDSPSSGRYITAHLIFTQAKNFGKKLKSSSLAETAFPEYKGSDEVEDALDFVTGTFIDKIGSREGKLIQCSGDFIVLEDLKISDAVEGCNKLLHLAARRHRDSFPVEADPF